MATVIIFNTVGLVVLFGICAALSIMLKNAYQIIRKIEKEKHDIHQSNEYHKKELMRRCGENENTSEYNLEERK